MLARKSCQQCTKTVSLAVWQDLVALFAVGLCECRKNV